MNAIEELAGILAGLKDRAVDAEKNLDNLWIDHHSMRRINETELQQ